MRFSTLTSTFQFQHSNQSAKSERKTSSSNIKKVLTTIVSKLPVQQQQKVAPETIKVISKNSQNKPMIITAIKKDTDMYRDVRNYYSQQNNNKKRPSSAVEQAEDNNKKLFLDTTAMNNKRKELQEKRNRESCHKTVKQYQQTITKQELCHHWKEEYSVQQNKYAQQQSPKWLHTHAYVRGELRSNSNYLRVAVLSNHASAAKYSSNCNNKSFLKKRKDEFIWGSPSHLRNSITPSSSL